MFTPVTLQAARSRRMGQLPPVIRFEITDELGEKFLPGATMEIWDGGTLILSKLADGGGNISITKTEMNDAIEALGITPLDAMNSLLIYSVSYPGYIPYQAVIWDPEKTESEQVNQLINVALVKEGWWENPYARAAILTGMFLGTSWAVAKRYNPGPFTIS